MAITRHDLCADRLRGETELVQRRALEPGREVRIGADRTGDLADSDLGARDAQAITSASELGQVARQRDAERGRLRMDAV